MGDKGEMTNQIKAMIFGNRSAAPQADQKPKKPRTIAYDRHSLVEIGKNTASHTRPSFLDVEYDNVSRVDGSKRWDPERWHAGTKAQHLKARREAAAKENAAQRSANAAVVGETNSWRKSKNEKRSGLAMDEEAENGKNDETFGATRLGPQRRSYKEGCKPENTRDEGPKGDASLGPSWRDSRKKEPWRRGGQDDNDKFSDFRNDGNNGPGGGGNKYGNNRDNNRYGNNGPNNRFGNSNNRGNNRYGRDNRFGRDSPDEEPEWMNPDDANEITFMSLEGLPGDMRGKENRTNKNRDSPELVAFDENAFMGTTDDGDGNIGGVLGAALGELDDGDELGGAMEDDPKMDGLIKSSFMDIMKEDDNDDDSVGAAAAKSSASKFSAFFDAGPELKPPTTTQKPAGAGFPPPQNIGVPAGLIPPTAAGLGMNVPAPNQPLGLNLWNIQQAGNPNSSANSHPTPEQQMKQQSAENSRVNSVFSQLQNPKVSSMMPAAHRSAGVPPMPGARNWDLLPGAKNEPQVPRPQAPPAGLPAGLFGFPNAAAIPQQQQQRAGPPMVPPRGFPMTAMSVEDLEGPRRNISPTSDNQPAPDVKRKLMNLRNEFDQKSNVQRMMFLGAQQPPNQGLLQQMQQQPQQQRMPHQMQNAPRSAAHQHMQQQQQQKQMMNREAQAAQEQRIRVASYLAAEEKNRNLTPTEANFMKQFRAEQNGLFGSGARTMIDQNLNQLNFSRDGRDNHNHSHNRGQNNQNLDFNRQKESFEEKLRQQSSLGSSGPPHPEVPKFNQFTPTSVMRKMVHRKGDEPERPHRNPKITPLEHTGVVRVPKGERKLSNGGVPAKTAAINPQMRSMGNVPPVIYSQQQRSNPPPVISNPGNAPSNGPNATQMLFHQRGLIPSQIRAPPQQQQQQQSNADENQMIHRLFQKQPQANPNRAFPDFG